MKKNVMMRVASIMLVLVLLTSSVISGTFAKYVTSGSATDSARVAAWGFGDSTTITFDLFDKSYTNVNSFTGENLIAPGTSKMDTVQLHYANTAGMGAPEVAYTIDLNVTASGVDADIEANENIRWVFNDAEYSKFTDMVAAIEAYHEDVDANTLPRLNNTGLNIGWYWLFSTDAAHDVFDTAMGDKANLDDVYIVIEYVATQVD